MSINQPATVNTSTNAAVLHRAEQACARCRKHKIKCVPSGLTDRCESCYKLRLNCIFDQTKKRRRRLSTAEGVSAKKVAMIEEGLNKVLAMLNPEVYLGQSLPISEESPLDGARTTPSGAMWNHFAWPNPSAALPPSPSLQQHDTFGEQLVNAIHVNSARANTPIFRSICYKQAQIVIETSKYLTFGLGSFIHSDGSLSELFSGDYPLVVAAMIVAAGPILQLDSTNLACEFRLIMSEILFNKGKRNVYVLQSLLIFLLRHVHYMNSEGPSVVMITNICISQIVDLAIDKKAIHPRAEESAGGEQDRVEEKAEYTSLLACNYLCCGLTFKCHSTKLGLPLAERAYQSVEAFLNDNTLEIPEDLLLITQLCGFIDEIQETFKGPTVPSAGCHQFDAAFTGLHMQRMELRLNSWQELVARRGLNQLSVTLAGRFARVLLYARALQPQTLILSHSSYSSSASGLRLSIHTYCLSAIKTLLDGVINLSEAELTHMNFVDWIWTMSTFTALGRLSHYSLASPDINLGSLNILGLYDHYTDAICKRVANSPAYSASKHGKWNFPVWLRKKCASTKQSSIYNAQTSATSSSDLRRATDPEHQGHDLENNPNRMLVSNLDLAANHDDVFNFADPDWQVSEFPWESLVSEI